MFRFLMMCLLLIPSVAWSKAYVPVRTFRVFTPCTIPAVTRLGINHCIIIKEQVRQEGDPGLRGGINWDSRPSLLMSGTSKTFALLYYLVPAPRGDSTRSQITVWDGDKFMNTPMYYDNPGVVFRVTRDGGKTWSKFYTLNQKDPLTNWCVC